MGYDYALVYVMTVLYPDHHHIMHHITTRTGSPTPMHPSTSHKHV